jgi:hypothetical protein
MINHRLNDIALDSKPKPVASEVVIGDSRALMQQILISDK